LTIGRESSERASDRLFYSNTAVVRSDASLASLPSSDNLFYVGKTLGCLANIKKLLSYAVRSCSLALRRLVPRTPRRSFARLSFEMRRGAMADVES
jgi:hypothetical protein